MNKLTPGKAIKLRCKDCQPENKTESFCVGCALKNNALSNLKKIKVYCKWCCNNYNPNDYCSSPECSLYPFKTGKNALIKRSISEEHKQALKMGKMNKKRHF